MISSDMPFQKLRLALFRNRVEKNLIKKFAGYDSLTLIMQGREAGFFSIFFQVIGALQFCKKYQHNLRIEFVGGSYFEEGRGQSWWDYYFSKNQFTYSNHAGSYNWVLNKWEQIDFSNYGRALASSVGNLFVDTVGIRDNIHNKVSKFYENKMNGQQVIGIHYRGTDKVSGAGKESDRVPFDDVCSVLNQFKRSHFFVATDEQAFLNHIENFFGGRVFSYNAIRSNNSLPIHSGIAGASMYKAGEDALVDCLLLSCCDKLVRTESNLSYACRYFNPRQKYTVIGK